jgi:hypothetical protein
MFAVFVMSFTLTIVIFSTMIVTIAIGFVMMNNVADALPLILEPEVRMTALQTSILVNRDVITGRIDLRRGDASRDGQSADNCHRRHRKSSLGD